MYLQLEDLVKFGRAPRCLEEAREGGGRGLSEVGQSLFSWWTDLVECMSCNSLAVAIVYLLCTLIVIVYCVHTHGRPVKNSRAVQKCSYSVPYLQFTWIGRLFRYFFSHWFLKIGFDLISISVRNFFLLLISRIFGSAVFQGTKCIPLV